MLAGFQGSLVVDGYKGYEALFGHRSGGGPPNQGTPGDRSKNTRFVETINTRSPLGPLTQ